MSPRGALKNARNPRRDTADVLLFVAAIVARTLALACSLATIERMSPRGALKTPETPRRDTADVLLFIAATVARTLAFGSRARWQPLRGCCADDMPRIKLMSNA
jgi:hypothetical protein